MKTITLPDELNVDTLLPIHVFDYRSRQEIAKQQIALNKNTFSFLSEGKKEVVFDNSSFSIDNSQFLLMKSSHCLMTEKLSDVSHHYRSVLLFFSNDVALKLIRKLGLTHSKKVDAPSVYSFPYDIFIKRFVDSLIDVSKLPATIRQKILEVKFEEIMLYLIGVHGTDFLFSLLNHTDNSTQKFIQTVESNQLNKLTLKELAFLCDMSVSSFKREFDKQYSESPIKWFQDKRLEYASYLLKQEQKRPSDIYFEVGYENLSSFIQAYKSKFGVTPKQHHKR